jgi:RNA polymerase sigma-70 factor (ECF subfamily)
MLEDTLLIWKFKSGDSDALARIYAKYRQPLLRMATGLLNREHQAEDIVHDVFLWLARSPEKVRLSGNLPSFLATCVVNRVRNTNRSVRRQERESSSTEASGAREDAGPEPWLIASEQRTRLNEALAELPYEQREAVVLHLQGQMKFREIAKSQNVSINTVQSRYRYGLEKLRSLLDGEV